MKVLHVGFRHAFHQLKGTLNAVIKRIAEIDAEPVAAIWVAHQPYTAFLAFIVRFEYLSIGYGVIAIAVATELKGIAAGYPDGALSVIAPDIEGGVGQPQVKRSSSLQMSLPSACKGKPPRM